MKKEKYESPVIEVTELAQDDIISTYTFFSKLIYYIFTNIILFPN